MKYDLIETGKRIAGIRKQNGLTQEQFAERLYVTLSHISKIEIGKKGASIEMLVDIAYKFDVSLDYLILGNVKDDEKEIQETIREAIDALVKAETKLKNMH